MIKKCPFLVFGKLTCREDRPVAIARSVQEVTVALIRMVSAGGHSCSYQDGNLARGKPLPGTERLNRSCLGKGGQVRTSALGLRNRMYRLLEQ